MGACRRMQSYDPVAAVLAPAGMGHLMPIVTYMFCPPRAPRDNRHYLNINGAWTATGVTIDGTMLATGAISGGAGTFSFTDPAACVYKVSVEWESGNYNRRVLELGFNRALTVGEVASFDLAFITAIVAGTGLDPAVCSVATAGSLADSSVWGTFKSDVSRSIIGGVTSSPPVVSTYSLVYKVAGAYQGGVLAPNGEIHFVPTFAVRGQKINAAGVVSTYSLAYTVVGAYAGGVLASNGDIHFVPYHAVVGQKISPAGVVSTYALAYTVGGTCQGGVLAPNGDIHFVPYSAVVGQKINAAGVVSTYSLAYTVADAYVGGVLAPNGDIHFVPLNAVVGQKISPAGVVSTYSLAYTVANAYRGGVLAPNGDIHFVPFSAVVGQKINAAGVVSTYSLAYTVANAYIGGVLAPNGDIHFVPYSATRGQKLSINPVVPFSLNMCLTQWINKL